MYMKSMENDLNFVYKTNTKGRKKLKLIRCFCMFCESMNIRLFDFTQAEMYISIYMQFQNHLRIWDLIVLRQIEEFIADLCAFYTNVEPILKKFNQQSVLRNNF